MADSQGTDEGPPNADWNTVWDVHTGTFDGGWIIEMAIPFKSLRYQPGTDQVWGINLRRVVRWKNEWSYLAQVPRALTTFRGLLKISSAGTLEGLQVPSGSANLEVKPFALAGVSTDRTVTPSVDNDATGRIGGDLKYGITQNITADLTVNTDFADAEVVERQLNLARFPLFYPEKRTFFTQDAPLFSFAGIQFDPLPFYSRRIGLAANGTEVDLLVGVIAHEIGHRPRRWAEHKRSQPRSKDELHELCRLEETYADFFAGRALAELGLTADPVCDFLLALEKHDGDTPHPEYFPAKLRAEVIREGYTDGKRQSDTRKKMFPELARRVNPKLDLGSG